MSEERPVRDRLGEALWRSRFEWLRTRWEDKAGPHRDIWLEDADRVIRLAADCGLKIELASPSPDAGGRG